MLASPSNGGPERDGLSDNIKRRVQLVLEQFSSLPDEALIEIRVVCALRGRSSASTWRDVAAGRLAPPVRVGERSSRWRVGDVRSSIRRARCGLSRISTASCRS
ncbi:transcriptional regulator, AlpA family [Rhizobiales bacterium GAS191]|nr:transcriptional regulator, AlpA family [Rhizobiales bacterium GAS191]